MSGTGFAARLSRALCVGCVVAFAASAAFAETQVAPGAAKAAECLSRPKGAAPQGERWFYRVERGTERHCWYTRAGAPRAVAAQKVSTPEPVKTASVPEPASEPMLSSVANARAEADLSAPAPAPPVAVTPRDLPLPTQSVNPADTLADRWPDQKSAIQTAQLQPRQVTEPPARTPIEAPAPASPEDDLLWLTLIVAAFAAALVGFAAQPILSFVRSRKQDRFFAGDVNDADNDLPFALPREAKMQLPPMRAAAARSGR